MRKRAGAAETASAPASSSQRRSVALFLDRDRVVPAAVKVLLQRDCLVCCASSASVAARQIAASAPDVAVLRISESSLEAVWLAKLIRKRAPRCRLVIVVDSPSEERAQVISSIGGDTLLTGPLDIERLLEQTETFLDEPGSPPASRPPLHGHVGRAMTYIIANYNQSLTASTAARAVGLSRSRLACLFRSTVGMTLKTYLVRFRLEVATRILVETGRQAGGDRDRRRLLRRSAPVTVLQEVSRSRAQPGAPPPVLTHPCRARPRSGSSAWYSDFNWASRSLKSSGTWPCSAAGSMPYSRAALSPGIWRLTAPVGGPRASKPCARRMSSGISMRRKPSICHCGDPNQIESVPHSTWSAPMPRMHWPRIPAVSYGKVTTVVAKVVPSSA